MPINIDRALGIHAQALQLRGRRTEVLAANLANADTPNYKARDIDFAATLNEVRSNRGGESLRVGVTHAQHMSPHAPSGPAFELLYRIPQQPSMDGNTVDAQREHAEFMQNAVQYQASLSFLGGRLRTLLAAIRGE